MPFDPADSSPTTRAVVASSAEHLETPGDQLFYADIESAFPWVKEGMIVWAHDREFASVVFWVVPNKPLVLLTKEKTYEGVSQLLRQSLGELPGSLSATDLAAAIRRLAVEPRGYVAGKDFLARWRPYLQGWTLGDKAREEILVAQCQDPVLETGPDKGWTLTFRYFNARGGVESWRVQGTPEQVTEGKQTMAAPDGTLHFPNR